MIKNDVGHSILLEGFLEIPTLPHSTLPYSPLQVMHRIASDINIDGFKVNKVNIFEDPLIANIELEESSIKSGENFILTFFKNIQFKSERQKLYICLTLTHSRRLINSQKITYSIKINKIMRNTLAETSIMNVACRVKDRLLVISNRAQQHS